METVDPTVTPTVDPTPAADDDAADRAAIAAALKDSSSHTERVADADGDDDTPAASEGDAPEADAVVDKVDDKPDDEPEADPAKVEEETVPDPDPKAAPDPKPTPPPAEQAVEKAAADPAELQRQQQAIDAYKQRVAKFKADMAAHKALVNSDKFDSFDPDQAKETARLQIEYIELDQIEKAYLRDQAQKFERAEVEEREAVADKQWWDNWQKGHPRFTISEAQILYEREYNKIAEAHPEQAPETIEFAATLEWQKLIGTMDGQRKARGKNNAGPEPKKPKNPTPRVTPGGARTMPETTRSSDAVTRELSPEEEFKRGMAGKPLFGD